MRIKKINHIVIIAFFISLAGLNLSCKSADSLSDAEQKAQLAELESILKEKSVQIDIKTVYPFNSATTTRVLNSIMIPRTSNTANRIDVTGDGHFITVSKTETKGNLPYFGEQRIAGGHYNSSDQGILFEGEPINYKLAKHPKKPAWEISYEVKDKTESTEAYEIQLLVFSSKFVEVNIVSTLKNVIRYQGELSVVEAVKP